MQMKIIVWKFLILSKNKTVCRNNVLIEMNLLINSFFFNWGISALQYCVSFCSTIKWISYMCIYICTHIDIYISLLSLTPSFYPTSHLFRSPLSTELSGVENSNPLQYSCLEKSPWTEEPCGLQLIGWKRVGHDWRD